MTLLTRAAKVIGSGMAFLAAACGATSFVVKRPVADQCASTGLKKCEALADAVVLYIDGEKKEAESKLREVSSANSPEQIRVFTKSIKPIMTPLGGDIRSSMDAVLAILEGPNATPGPSAAPEAKAAQRPAGPPHVGGTNEVVRTGTARPATASRSMACSSDVACRQTRVFLGPFTVTNLYAGGGCPDELFVLAGQADNPHWTLAVPPNATLSMSGKFALDEGEGLFVGVRSSKGAPQSDPHCAILWSGVRVESEENGPPFEQNPFIE